MNIFKRLFYTKYNHSLTITNRAGLHLRPIAKFVKFTKTFDCDISIEYSNLSKSAKNINDILSLGVSYQDTIILSTKGKDAKKVLTQVVAKLQEILRDDEKNSIEKEQIKPTDSYIYSQPTLSIEPIYQGIEIYPIYNLKIKTITQEREVDIKKAISTLSNKLDLSNSDIVSAQRELLLSLNQDIESIEELEREIDTHILNLPPSLTSKAIDYKDILKQIKEYIGVSQELQLPTKDSIVVAQELLPSDIEEIQKCDKVKAIILQNTSTQSHSAILLKGAGVVSAICDDKFEDEEIVILDTQIGAIKRVPTQEDLKIAKKKKEALDDKLRLADENKFQASITKSGKKIEVLANITDYNSALKAKEAGAVKVGLLRSEFIFTQTKPTLKEQIEIYQKIFELFDEVTVRTLDVGGDKSLPYIPIPKEQNPFLGIRGVRLFNIVPDIISTQLEAIYLASKKREIKIMFPMVSTPNEFIKAKEFAQDVAKKSDIDISHIKFGMMIETPSTLFSIDRFNELVDFYSIGSNDLAQYSFAIQRGHESLRYDESSQEFLNILSHITKHTTKELSLCGELASNRDSIKALIDLGIDRFSVSPSNIAIIKEEIRDV